MGRSFLCSAVVSTLHLLKPLWTEWSPTSGIWCFGHATWLTSKSHTLTKSTTFFFYILHEHCCFVCCKSIFLILHVVRALPFCMLQKHSWCMLQKHSWWMLQKHLMCAKSGLNTASYHHLQGRVAWVALVFWLTWVYAKNTFSHSCWSTSVL